MLLSSLIAPYFVLPADYDCQIAGLQLDSRKVRKQEIFCALNGHSEAGSDYIAAAIQNGAVAILWDSDALTITLQNNIPIIPISDLRSKISALAARFYAQPAAQMQMVGITGTSGKTSCSHFVNQLLAPMGANTAVIGTLGSGIYTNNIYHEVEAAGLTTPDPISLQKLLHLFATRNVKTVAMEVSSHSIAQSRIDAIPFAIAAYTNLSPEHLDYHLTMENYAAVKQQFLFSEQTACAILNVDDDYGRKWLPQLAEKKRVYPFSTQQELTLPNAVYCSTVEKIAAGFSGHLHSPWGEADFRLPLMGEFNLSNALLAFTAACHLGVPFAAAIAALGQIKPVLGRMQLVSAPNLPTIIVDYAHKPDALKKVLQAIRSHTSGNIICVFGCGGERDQQKRPLMAAIAESLADEVIVTNDNPRHENQMQIMNDILAGFREPQKVHIELDRAQAIANGIARGSARDCVLIAGRGGERFQKIGDQLIPFDDAEIVEKIVATQRIN